MFALICAFPSLISSVQFTVRCIYALSMYYATQRTPLHQIIFIQLTYSATPVP